MRDPIVYGFLPLRVFCGLLLACGSASADSPAPDAAPFGHPQLTGLIDAPGVEEISGITASGRSNNLFWVINDSGNSTEVHALDATGRMQGRVRVRGVRNIDWEEIHSFEFEGRPHLLIGDVGDNGAIRSQVHLLAIEEPLPPGQNKVSSISPAWTVHVRFPKGPRDCEAIAIDQLRGQVLLLSKRRVPPELYRVPLKPKKSKVVTARFLSLVNNIPQPTPEELASDPHWGRYRSQPTSMDISPDGNRLVVLTYRNIFVYERQARETWAEAFTHSPARLVLPLLPQAEAITFSRNGRAIYVTSERLPSPLLRFERLPAED